MASSDQIQNLMQKRRTLEIFMTTVTCSFSFILSTAALANSAASAVDRSIAHSFAHESIQQCAPCVFLYLPLALAQEEELGTLSTCT